MFIYRSGYQLDSLQRTIPENITIWKRTRKKNKKNDCISVCNKAPTLKIRSAEFMFLQETAPYKKCIIMFLIEHPLINLIHAHTHYIYCIYIFLLCICINLVIYQFDLLVLYLYRFFNHHIVNDINALLLYRRMNELRFKAHICNFM